MLKWGLWPYLSRHPMPICGKKPVRKVTLPKGGCQHFLIPPTRREPMRVGLHPPRQSERVTVGPDHDPGHRVGTGVGPSSDGMPPALPLWVHVPRILGFADEHLVAQREHIRGVLGHDHVGVDPRAQLLPILDGVVEGVEDSPLRVRELGLGKVDQLPLHPVAVSMESWPDQLPVLPAPLRRGVDEVLGVLAQNW